MEQKIRALEARLGLGFLPYQWQTLARQGANVGPSRRVCLYYKTGAGKTLTSLALLHLWGQSEALVVTPPSTHDSWYNQAAELGITVQCISHAKFRAKDFKVDRKVPIIADEFHMFGRNTSQGWKKLEVVARGLQAPIILASATPNYNDAERVYCIQRILDPASCKGGFLQFLYTHCETEADPFSMTPKVKGFRNYPDAASYLASLPNVEYLPDDLQYLILNEFVGHHGIPLDHEKFGLDPMTNRLWASQMEERHRRAINAALRTDGVLRAPYYDRILDYLGGEVKVLVFANHSTVAEGAYKRFMRTTARKVGLITGKTSQMQKLQILDDFRNGDLQLLIGTTALATGTDGLDKVCDTLIIIDDTDDDALRRQLIGRIMPRGKNTDASGKTVLRIQP